MMNVGYSNPKLSAALAFAGRRWHVLPLHTIRSGRCSCGSDHTKDKDAAKHPLAALVRHGCKDATTDTYTLRRWWADWPDANVGISTGAASGLLVLDVDGPVGAATLADLERQHGALPL